MCVCAVCIFIAVFEAAHTAQLTVKPPHGDRIASAKCLCAYRQSKPPTRRILYKTHSHTWGCDQKMKKEKEEMEEEKE